MDRGNCDFQGKYFKAKGAVLEPKPHQKPHPPPFFGGTDPRMLHVAGRYADICLIPLADKDGVNAREEVIWGAKSRARKGNVAFAGATEALPQPWHDYDRDRYLERFEFAKKLGCEYIIVPFPWKTYFESLEDFAKNILPPL